MAKSKNRVVVNDIQAPGFQKPGKASGTNLPRANTSPTSRNSTNSIMQSFAGFNKALGNIALSREKNNAAVEALEARNTALAGEYKTFDRQESVDAFEQATGQIQAQSTALLFKEHMTAANVDLINQRLPLAETLAGADAAASAWLEENAPQIRTSSEAYKSGFLPGIINTKEGLKTALAEQYAVARKGEQLDTLTDAANMAADEFIATARFDPTDPDGAGGVDNVRTFDISAFKSLQDTGIALGLTRAEATEQTLLTLAAKAEEEANPELLEFAKQRLPDGTLLENNLKYNKIIDDARVKAMSTRIAALKEADRKEDRRMKEGRRSSQIDTMDHAIDNPESVLETKQAIQGLAKKYKWTPAELKNALDFAESVSGDGAITLDPKVEEGALRLILDGHINTPSQLQSIYNETMNGDRNGINLAALKRLQTHMKAVVANGNKANAFKIQKDRLLRTYGLSENTIFLPAQKGESEKEFTQRKLVADLVGNYDEGLQAFLNAQPDAILYGPEATQFFSDHFDRVMASANIDPVTVVSDSDNPAKSFTGDDFDDEEAAKNRSDTDAFNKEKKASDTAQKAQTKSKEELKIIHDYNRGL